jgi:hypothetical protein
MFLNPDGDLSAWRRQGESRRRLRRWAVNMRAAIRIAGGAEECTVVDLSPAGARVRLDAERQATVGGRVELELDGYGVVVCEVRYSAGGNLGLMFLHDDAGEVELARYLVSRRPTRRAARQKVSARGLLTPRKAQSVCVVDDISRTGASVMVDNPGAFAEGDEVLLNIAGFGDVVATVRRVAEDRLGLMFHQQLDGDLPR